MNKKDFIRQMLIIETLGDEFNDVNDSLGNIFGVDSTAENKFLPIFYKMRDSSISNLAKLVGDTGGWIMWYIDDVSESENKSLPATVNGECFECKTISDIYDIIAACK